MALTLRPYQQAALDAIEKNLAKTNKQVVVMPTGSGKTVVFCHLIKQRKNLGKTLILAHREELLEQATNKLLQIDPTLNVQIEMANQKAEPDADVVVASVPTLGRANSERITKFDPKHFKTIIGDEFHHFSSPTNKNVLRYFGVLKKEADWNKECLLTGFTATPSRSDNQGIDQVADEIVYKYEIIDAMRDGYLARVKAFRVDTDTSLDEVHTLAGDFNQGELGEAINNSKRNNLIVKTYLEQFIGKQVLVFAINIEHAEAMTKAFLDKSVKAAIVTGETNKTTRKEITDSFLNKELNVLVNVGVMTEGVDIPTIDAVFLARPTKSSILFSQMSGRGMRLHPDKPFCSLVDFVDNTYRHRLKTAASLLGIEGNVNFRGKDILEAYTDIQKIRELAPTYNLDRLDFNKLKYIMEEVDLVGGLEVPKEIQEATNNAWYRYGEDAYRLNIGDQRYFVIRENMLNRWQAEFEYWDIDLRKTVSEYLGEEDSKDSLIQRVDRYINNNYPESLRLIRMGAQWRKDRITDNQVKMLMRLGVNQAILYQMNKGQASQLTTKLLSQLKRR